ncbi:hypothetical protein JAAARDRAFT_49992 [Jaapia argillacea MUCL 33604]|uniref:G domain-containing protein n=1 Tax=Jaapia argillacea MUCL 33604 TaxID=933084 RepID=A0A067PE13_9AGAM|nr:hypothetical protein JAAARDRAFT_49992 [Jaapia argillacea MUCL 33604]
MLRISANIEKAYIEALRDLAFERALLKGVGAQRISFLVLGPSGVGKSSFIAAVTGKDIPLGKDSLSPCTTDISTIPFRETIKFIDTPPSDEDGFYCDLKTSKAILQRTEGGCTIVLYFHSIDRNRLTCNLANLNDFCKDMHLKQIVFVTTIWDEVPNDIAVQRERELMESWSSVGPDVKAKTGRFMQTRESGWAILHKAAGFTPLPYCPLQASAPNSSKGSDTEGSSKSPAAAAAAIPEKLHPNGIDITQALYIESHPCLECGEDQFGDSGRASRVARQQ